MIFIATPLDGAFVIEPERHEDERGFFARVWCAREFEAHGLAPTVAQANLSFSRYAGMIRGMHYQIPPRAEAKTVSCSQGAIYDVIIDVRPESPTFCDWFGAELTAANRRMLHVPEGFAHGFQALTDDVVVTYLVSESYAPGSERGIRHDDPCFAIDWPLRARMLSEKDRSWPDFVPEGGVTSEVKAVNSEVAG